MAGENNGEELNLALEMSDDEAPEEMTFESARTQALRYVEMALESEREKEQLQHKRRRTRLLQERKKRRLLPVDVLDQVDSAAQEQEQSRDEEPEKPAKEKLSASRSLMETYTVTAAKEQISFQQQAAQDFLHARLYGPESRRSTNNALLSLQNKTGRSRRAAVQFVRRNWAVKEKAKAEKVKQRWIHKTRV